MALIYFPGCKYTAHSPENSKRLQAYLQERFAVTVTGCCSKNYQTLSGQDTFVFVCPTCWAILRESAPHAKSLSIWELLAGDERFLWPDYQGRTVTIQDCWRTFDNRGMQNAVRTVIKRMNLKALEIDDSYDKAGFCGVSLLKPYSPRYEYLAPVRFIQNAGHKFSPCSEEEQKILMKEHCRQYLTDTVACYCTGCLEGIRIGGVGGVHLMDLVFNSF